MKNNLVRYLVPALLLATSALCAADKLATTLVPTWLYLSMVRLSGELDEYLALARRANFYLGDDPEEWFRLLCNHWRTLAREQATKAHQEAKTY